MKAFQLKIAIKNSKPPIWRRVIVPAGITFSQLSIILNKSMGWDGYHLFEFEFEFFHQELRIIEGADEYEIGYGPYDYLEASTTYIREYLEENNWFTYTYDLGDHWNHRVTIEKIIEEYEENYPKVIKYKGDCPLEDCGGIYGYYDCLDIIQDKSHPEYEERVGWMQLQGYPNKYDMVAVNEELERECFYVWGKAEKRLQRQIYGAFFSGKYGLYATEKDKNKNLTLNKSGKHQMNEASEAFVQSFKDAQRRIETECSLENIFDDFEKKDIYEIAREKGVKGISRCNKEHLIEKLVEFMLQPEVMERYFLCLQDEQIEEFEKAIKQGWKYNSEKRELLLDLYEGGYIGMLTDGSIMIPYKVSRLYHSLVNSEFHLKRKMLNFILGCLRVSGALYGITPIEILLKMIDQHPDINMTPEEVKTQVEIIPPEFLQYVIVDDKIYHKDLYPYDRGLLMAQGGKEYYIPSLKEINDFNMYGYFPNDSEFVKFKRYLIKDLDAMEDEAEFAARIIQRKICGDCQMEEIFEVLEDLGLMVDTDWELNKLVNKINDLWNGTRMILNRGYTPNELFRLETNQMLPLKTSNNIINFQEARKNKIYPNDACPCGSGKKYKKCCGRRKV